MNGPLDRAPAPTDPSSALLGGSWPGTDVAEAVLATLGEAGDDHWPVLPELPDRGPGADPVGRAAALVEEVGLDLQPHGWRVLPHAGDVGVDRRRARSCLTEDLNRWGDTAEAEGHRTRRIAVRLPGPATLLAGLWLPSGERSLIDAGARREVLDGYAAAVAGLARRVRAHTGAEAVGVLLEEPDAAAVLAGALPTASGYRTVRALARDELRGRWAELAAAALVDGGADRVWLAAGRAGVDAADDAGWSGAAVAGLAVEAVARAGRADAAEGDGARAVVAVSRPDPDAPGGRALWDVLAGVADRGEELLLREDPRAPVEPAALLRDAERCDVDPARLAGWRLGMAGPASAARLRRLGRAARELTERLGER